MARQAKLRKHKGHWVTNAGSREGVSFGKIDEVSYGEANKAFRKYLASLKPNAPQRRINRVSTADVCDQHLDTIPVTDRLYKQRKSILKGFINHRVGRYRGRKLPYHGKKIGTIPAHRLVRAHLEQYLEHVATVPSERTKKPLGPTSLRSIVIAVKRTFNWAADGEEDGGGGLIPDDFRPFAKVPRPFIPPRDLTEADLPTDEETDILIRWGSVDLDKIRDDSGKLRPRKPHERRTGDDNPWIAFQDMIQVYHECGPRTGEVAELQVRDFMPRTRQLVLGRHKRVKTQKNPTMRTLQISPELCEILKKHCKGKKPNDPIFTNSAGNNWDSRRINRRLGDIKRVAKKEGNEVVRKQITPYSFRHLYISELLMIGTPIFKVAKMAGTSALEIERTYGHFFNHDLAESQAKLVAARKKRRKKAAVLKIA